MNYIMEHYGSGLLAVVGGAAALEIPFQDLTAESLEG